MEKLSKPTSGYIYLLIEPTLLAGTISAFIIEQFIADVSLFIIF